MSRPTRMNETRMKYPLLSLVIFTCLFNTTARADGLYAEVGATYITADDTYTKLHPVLPKAKLGYAITPNYMIELQYAGNNDDKDEITNATLEIDNISAAYLRLDSGLHAGFRMYVLIGQAETNLTATGMGGLDRADGKYSDFSWGVGIEDNYWSEGIFLTLEYTEYYKEDDVSIAGASLGLKYAF